MLNIYLDLDGVIRDWAGGVGKLFEHPFTPDRWDYYIWYCNNYDIDKDKFWTDQDEHPTFWTELETYPHTTDLLKALSSYGDVTLCTSPMKDNAGLSQRWIKKWLPFYYDNNKYILTPCKEKVAGPGKILIDDYEENCRKWRDAGGLSIIFPQPWNSLRGLMSDKIQYVKNHLDMLKKILDT